MTQVSGIRDAAHTARTLTGVAPTQKPPRGERWRLRLVQNPLVKRTIVSVMRHTTMGEVYDRVETTVPAVALTFDDGPNPPYTEEILQVLARYRIKATFFMIGRNIESHPDTARAVLAHGHEIGNHSYSHSPLVFRTPAFVRSELAATDNLLRALGASGEIHFRSPYALHLFAVPLVLTQQRRTNILGRVGGLDWDDQDAERITARVVQGVSPGSIILLHDGSGARQGTVVATRMIIEQLRTMGYQFVSIWELLALPRRA
ncbi:MAG TPA: polysaccharide deacetylase family protein [Candidatus Binatia bacterium]|nr:polysaccharide deacetylase family protein [Candidatus Binatia bacterium]